ncbi:uncharacterized protein LOC128739706 [Sabethes cyaneus]|uniref:uncharacterized protein LOC128739706 n=1 Tax=Sabethes cyaneus TaxID=53552 RepID=UPI00237EAEC4|nr:uncharacterized protein LOC128739706 [Sabethes cyaneus]
MVLIHVAMHGSSSWTGASASQCRHSALWPRVILVEVCDAVQGYPVQADDSVPDKAEGYLDLARMPRKTRTRDAVPDITLQQSCPLCQLPDCDEMVCCDDCERWYHFQCVGVNDDVANYDWSCPECVAAKVPAQQSPHPKTTADEPIAQPQLPRSNQRLPTPQTPISPVPPPQPRSTRPPLVQLNMPTVSGEVVVDPDLVNKLPVELRIKMLEEEEAIERKFLRRKYQLLLEASVNKNHVGQGNSSANMPATNNARDPPIFHSSPMNDYRSNDHPPHAGHQNRDESVFVRSMKEQPIRVPANVPHSLANRGNSSAFGPVPPNQRAYIPVPVLYPPPVEQRPNASSFAPRRPEQFEYIPSSSLPNRHQHPNASAFAPLAGLSRYATQEQYPCDSLGFSGAFGGTTLLNSSQIAARQAIAKELPIFCGDPEEWPLFFATYENSTNLCGYSPEENLARLQKCLRGKALDAVKCQLLHPTNLGQVLSTLKMLFGRPDIIVHSLLQKINVIPSPKEEHLGSLVDFALAVRNMVATIKACELEQHLCNPTLLHNLTKRLPPMIRLNWATHRQSLPSVTVLDFSDWLYNLAEAASAVTLPDFSSSSDSKSRRGRKDDGFLNAHTETEQQFEQYDVNSCFVCHGDCDAVEKCKKFLSSGLSVRWDILRKYKLCRSCLGNHRGPCESGKLCGKNGCQYKHHRLLHNDSKDKQQVSSSSLSNRDPPEADSCNTHRGGRKSVLFQYIPVVLHHNGIALPTYAFLDSGSSLTLMEESLAEELNLRGEKYPLCLRWTADTCRYEKDAMMVSVKISGTHNHSGQHRLSEVYTVKDLKLPPQSLPARKFSEQYAQLKGLPIESYSNVQPKLLIGMSNARMLHPLEGREGKLEEPAAIKTRLGWSVYGVCPLAGTTIEKISHSFHVCFHSRNADESLHEAVKNYFALDSLGIQEQQNHLFSKEDKRALTKLQESTMFRNGRYEVSLLWKYDDVHLPNNRSMALRRHRCRIKRMERDAHLSNTVRDKMTDYERKGYIRKLTPEESRKTSSRTWYLPIFPVSNANKPGKVRIVFDAAASFKGVSLNSVLMKGPDQLNALPAVLYKFRERLVGLGGDIAEMFHQMRMNPSDEDSQRILWCANEESGEACDYVMQVVTFGATCSPSTALFVLNENASRFESIYPAAVDAIRHRHYVDDMLTSVETEEEAIKLAKEVHYIHLQGGFQMRNWVSNSPAVLEALGEVPKTEKSMDMNAELAMEKVLGMWWSAASDVFRYKLCTDRNKELLTGVKHPTKRDVLRTLMSIYDPLGLIAHYLMYLKVLLQEIWRSKTNWDEPISEKELQKWLTWLRILPELESVEIPRCYFKGEVSISETAVELHTFVDASENGYAVVAYFRFEYEGRVQCMLIGSKTRVAPIKFVSIPRLELQAAVVGSRFARSVAENHSIQIARRYFWTDARDVLCWLQSDHRRYSQYVAFRVGEILETTNISEWRWLGTKFNVADDGTKWNSKPDLKSTSRWFKGPSFLWQPKSVWPVSPLNVEKTNEEIRPCFLSLHFLTDKVRTILLPQNFSSWNRLRRVTAYVLRYVTNIRQKLSGQRIVFEPLTQKELLNAEVFHYKRAQQDEYGDELTLLLKGNRLNNKNRLYKTSPFIDENGVMRIHTRLTECDFVDTSDRFPIVLPRSHPLTRLIVHDIHLRYHHQCRETYVNEVRKSFYIPRVRMVCDQVRRSCQTCKVLVAKPIPPAMAPLPKARLAAYVRPFSYVGVDYFGPFPIAVGRRHEKRWGVIVTCLTTRAVHLELAASLNTSSCILALRNCFARRGTPIEIVSDRGTNFVGAEKELKQAMSTLNMNDLQAEFTTPSTVWRFNPPASPHMGGCWERLIQSVKKILARVKPQRVPTEEALRSYLIQVENIINSRPLTHVPVDNHSSPALTPNHFLVGSTNGLKPLVPYTDCPLMLQRSWRASDALANLFWKRWVAEYLPTITRRTKWFYPAKPIAVGAVVVVVDPNMPRNCWPKGRVLSVKTSTDGQVRSVKTSTDGQVRSAVIQTANGIYERPAVKLAVIDVGANESESDQGPITGGECCVYTAPTMNTLVTERLSPCVQHTV